MDTSSPHYLALSAQQKNEIIRSNIEQDTQPAVWPSPLQLPGLFMEKVHAFIMDNNKYGSVQELRSTFGHRKSFKTLG